MVKRIVVATAVLLGATLLSGAEAPLGSQQSPSKDDQKKLDALKGTISGKIVWASSRDVGKHDIWICNADGTDPKQLTNSPNNVDWFSRFSGDGNKVLFTRSKAGWVSEEDAEMFDKWDVWMIGTDGTNEEKVVENACWGTWRPGDQEIVFARGGKVFTLALSSKTETEIFDAEKQFKAKTFAQQPSLSPDGKLLCMTLRGTTRQTGIYNLEKKVWNTTGGGCEIIFAPDGKSVVRMNEGQGNGGTEVLRIAIDPNGVPTDKVTGMSIDKKIRLMDLPGRMSHEYFPKFDQGAQWMVWCSTDLKTGHEHDIADYELFIWKLGADKKSAVRLSYHTGNDRWPDLFIAK
jgi:hypothetical protein